MNAVGIDVSKGKSMVAALRPMGEVALLPQEFLHTEIGLEQMAYAIIALGEDTRVVMEATGRYHEPVAAALYEYGIYVCVLNPLFIKQSGGGSIRKVKTDKADAMKIAKYGLDNWVNLREYTPMDTVRQQLKLCSRQYNLYMKTVVSLQNNLISLTDKTFSGVNELLTVLQPGTRRRPPEMGGLCHDLLALRLHLPCQRKSVYRALPEVVQTQRLSFQRGKSAGCLRRKLRPFHHAAEE